MFISKSVLKSERDYASTPGDNSGPIVPSAGGGGDHSEQGSHWHRPGFNAGRTNSQALGPDQQGKSRLFKENHGQSGDRSSFKSDFRWRAGTNITQQETVKKKENLQMLT